MVCFNFYCEFITSFHTHYNGSFLKPISWCHLPIEKDYGYVEFIKRSARNYINTTFLAKYDFKNQQILIKCEYNYFEHYVEKSEVDFILKGYKNNTYNYKNIYGDIINHLADEEILSFIKLFDQFYLEQTDIPLRKDEFEMYLKHLKKYPKLISDYTSDICDFKIDVYYYDLEYNIVVRFSYHDKINKYKDMIEYYLFKNRMVGDDYNDLNFEVNNIISTRMDEIYIDYTEFVELRLK
jgi:hypothetical protein